MNEEAKPEVRMIALTSSNFKNLKAIEMRFDGNVARLTGKNGAGKSAVLDAIFCCLTGKRFDDAIRHGQDKAEVVVDMGSFKVRKRLTAKGEYVEVIMANGDKKQSPQTFLDNIIGKLSFDPLAFTNLKPTEQRNLLKQLVGLDFTDIEVKQKDVYDRRTVVNSSIKGSVATLGELEAPHPSTGNDEIKFGDELEKINVLREKRTAFMNVLQQKTDLESEIGEVNRGINEHEEEILRLTKNVEQLKIQKKNFQDQHDAIVIPPEVSENAITAAESKLKDIENENVKIRSAARYRQAIKEGEKLRQDADKLTQEHSRLEQDKATRIANAKFPIKGLSMSDDAVIFDGIPFSRLSTGQQIRVSTAIAMKLNPTVKVIFIREGSLLDEAGKKEIFDLAKDNDYLVLMEEVDETGDIGFFIEDGSIKAIDGKEIPRNDAVDTMQQNDSAAV